ncbi:aminotransferase class V (plasmid) [Thalassoporum mexicanum PCC 7367]|uniref:aminotransferase class V-fold PLP-dependent enzyme n=1 Tax=Thalassoporum mexicanum TaxID=3457544 RepID=UPI00029F9750|nr:aminotransferase class V-fold PLP-dependent enzyme [Pseudanabaena sp. PCC 7367]AFY72136.1 aminotransferase class V [Pseudanabaena sp. PCC 7367]
MPGLLSHVDPDGLLEYSVVFSDRSVNHMSQQFQGVMKDISATLKQVYAAQAVAIVPGGGTFGMEAVARQFATGKKCLVIRNGWFSFRWTQILETGKIPAAAIVLKAQTIEEAEQPAFAPAAIDAVIATIKTEKPDVVFAPHVETSAGIILPNDYIQAVAEAVHAVGGLLVLDCVASGAIWVNMARLGVDVLISAPQKGWSGTPCAGLVMLSELASQRIETTESSSFACDLKKWLQIMHAYENGGHAYHATMPTDGLKFLDGVMAETAAFGFEQAHSKQQELGDRVRQLLASKGFKSVAAAGYLAPSVVVSYCQDSGITKQFMAAGVQVAAGVPLRCDEPESFQTFRIGLFGLDKLKAVDRTVANLAAALEKIV